MTPEQIPFVGATVHYVARGSADGVYPPICRAATITEVGQDGRVGLCAINPTGIFFRSLAEGGNDYSPIRNHDLQPGTWHFSLMHHSALTQD